MRRAVHAGPLSAVVEDGDLRWVRWNGVEVVRRLGFAVRDVGWGTVPAATLDVTLDARADGFAVTVEGRHVGAGLDLAWTGTIAGAPSGEIVYGASWTAQGPFAYNRIGLVALLPAGTVAGRPYITTGPSGEARGKLSRAVAPQPFVGGHYVGLAPPMTSLLVDLEPGVVHLSFAGDLFELEDQRNWADDSFKAYSTPLAVPVPRHAEAGRRVDQAVTLQVSGPPPARPEAPTIAVGDAIGRVGAVGVGLPPGERLDPMLGAAFVRVEAGDAPDAEALARASAEVELAVRDDDEDRGVAVAEAAAVARVVRGGSTDDPTDPRCCAGPAPAGATRWSGGTHRWFAELNRWRPPADGYDAMAFAASPQVHDRDDASIAENVAGLRAALATATELYPGVPIAVRLLFAAEGADPRLATPWGGAWLAAALAELLAGGAATVAALDVAQLRDAPEARAAFALLAGMNGLPRLERTDPPAGVGALAYARDGAARLLLANAGADERAIAVAGPRDGDAPQTVRVAAASWTEVTLGPAPDGGSRPAP